MFRDRSRLRFVLAFACAMLMTGTTSAISQQPATKTLRVGLASDIDTLDPVLSNTIAGRSVLTALCDKLLDIDENLAFVPRLAERDADLQAVP